MGNLKLEIHHCNAAARQGPDAACQRDDYLSPGEGGLYTACQANCKECATLRQDARKYLGAIRRFPRCGSILYGEKRCTHLTSLRRNDHDERTSKNHTLHYQLRKGAGFYLRMQAAGISCNLVDPASVGTCELAA